MAAEDVQGVLRRLLYALAVRDDRIVAVCAGHFRIRDRATPPLPTARLSEVLRVLKEHAQPGKEEEVEDAFFSLVSKV